MKEKKGIMFKGKFCEVWGGVYLGTTSRFHRGTLPDVSRTLKANMHDAGVVVEYEEDNSRDVL